MKKYISHDMIQRSFKGVFIFFISLALGLGLFMLPANNLTAGPDESNIALLAADCKIKEIIHGDSKGIFGCWGSETRCKTKCYK